MKLLNKTFPVILLIAGVLFACESDYDIGKVKYGMDECIGVNAVLNPLNPVQINLFQLKRENKKYVCSGLEGAYLIIKEEDTILYDGLSADSILTLPQHPQAGKSYSIEVSYGSMETVIARTEIPENIRCNVSMELVPVNINSSSKDYLVRLNSFEVNSQSKASLWITAHQATTDGVAKELEKLYCSHALTDRENAETDTNGARNKWVGSVYYEMFLRFKCKNTYRLDEILFTPYAYNYNSNMEKLVVQLVSANPEYDQYCKTLYRQELIKSYNDDPLSMMFYQPDEIYSNIENGLGIFAGINQQNYYFDAEK